MSSGLAVPRAAKPAPTIPAPATRRIGWQPPGDLPMVTLDLDEGGSGPTTLLLPALSSISTRGEMAPLAARLGPYARTIAADWPGFGALPRPRIDWTPDLLSMFLDWLIDEAGPAAIVAAGHAASYALQACAARPGRVRRLALVAPTWRGPLPTMVGASRPWFGRIRAAVDAPMVGPLLYRANVSGPMLGLMAREHVYVDPGFLGGDRLAAKRAVTRAGGARHASVRFVTGQLDRVGSRDAFLRLAGSAGVPILAVFGEDAPRRSRAEMEALAALPGVEAVRLPRGRLALHEEYPDAVAGALLPFLAA